MSPARRRPAALLTLLTLLVAGVAFQLLLAHVHAGRPLLGDEVRYRAEAMQVAMGSLPPPTFFWPPLYAILVGGFLWLAGSLAPVYVFQAGALLLAALLLRRLLRHAGLPGAAADLAAALLLLDPQWAAFAQYLWPEVPHLFVTLGAAALLLIGPLRPGRALLAGLLLGVALLLKSLLGPFLPLLACIAAWRARGLAAGLLVLAGAGALLLPFAAVNHARTGHFRIAGSGVLNLVIGLEDPASRDDYDSAPRAVLTDVARFRDPGERDRYLLERAEEKVKRDGVFAVAGAQMKKQYGRLLDRESFFTDLLPGGRVRRGEAPGPLDRLLRAWALSLWGATLALCAYGLFQPRGRKEWRAAALPAAFLAFQLALFFLLHVKTRFRVQMAPALLFFAALAASRLAGSVAEWRLSGRPPRPGPRALLGGAAAAAALALAFRL